MASHATNDGQTPAARPSTASIAITAIFGWSDECVATNPSDVAVAFSALNANVIVSGRGGQRSIPFTEFHRLPGDTPGRDNVLETGDLLIAIEMAARIEGGASS